MFTVMLAGRGQVRVRDARARRHVPRRGAPGGRGAVRRAVRAGHHGPVALRVDMAIYIACILLALLIAIRHRPKYGGFVFGFLLTISTLCFAGRAELKSRVLDRPGFRNLLDLVPAVRELVTDFYSSRYAACLAFLARYKERRRG